MAYNTEIAERVRNLMLADPDISEKKMFGGLCFLHNSHMVCGIVKNELMVRVGPEVYESCLAKSGVREMDFTGKPLKGMVFVAERVIENDDELFEWLQYGLDYTTTLPPKK